MIRINRSTFTLQIIRAFGKATSWACGNRVVDNILTVSLIWKSKEDINNQDELIGYFDYGMALVGISLIYDEDQNPKEDLEENDAVDKIEEFSRAIGPILITKTKTNYPL